jgi:hypothetical protein
MTERLSWAMAIEDVRAIRIAPKKGPVNQGGEHASADVFAQSKQPTRLGLGQLHARHLLELHQDTSEKRRSRGGVSPLHRRVAGENGVRS